MSTPFEIAQSLLGLREVEDKDKLMAFFKANSHDGDMIVDPSVTSWCADFMNCTQRAGGKEGTGKLNAQSFLTYGEEVKDWDEAKEGDIVVFHFPNDAAWQGHVTYFVTWNDDANGVDCLGGNQSSMVKISTFSQNYISSIRRA